MILPPKYLAFPYFGQSRWVGRSRNSHLDTHEYPPERVPVTVFVSTNDNNL